MQSTNLIVDSEIAGLDADLNVRISLAASTGRLDLSECGMLSFPLHYILTFDFIFFIFFNAASFKISAL